MTASAIPSALRRRSSRRRRRARRLHGRPRLRAARGAAPAAYKEAAGLEGRAAQRRRAARRWWEVFGDPELNALDAQVDVSNQTRAGRGGARARSAGAPRRRRAPGCSPRSTSTPRRCAARAPAARRRSGTRPAGIVQQLQRRARRRAGSSTCGAGIRRSVEASEAARAGERRRPRGGAAVGAGAARAELPRCCACRTPQIALLARHRRRLRALAAADAEPLRRRHRRARRRRAGRSAARRRRRRRCSTRRSQRAQLEHAIAVLVGKPPAELSIAPKPLVAVFPQIPVARAVRAARAPARHRRGRAARRGANAQIGVAQAAFFPALSLGAIGGLQSSAIGSLLSPAEPLLVARRRRSRRRSSTPACAGAEGRRRSPPTTRPSRTTAQTVLTGFQEVEDNLAALRILEQEAAVQDDAVKAARESATIAQQPVQGRERRPISPSSCCRPRRSTTSARRSASSRRRLTASVGLIKALGGGWNATALAQAAP